MHSQRLKKNMNLLEPRRLGLIRNLLKICDYVSKLGPPNNSPDSTFSPFPGSFHEAKVVRTEIEAKGAETMCHVHRMMAAPR